MKLPMKRHGRWICTAPPTEDIAKLCFDKLTEGDDIIRAANAHAALVEALEAALPVLNHITRPMVQPEAEAEALQLGIAALALAKGDTP